MANDTSPPRLTRVEAILWLSPILMGIVAFAIGALVGSAQAERYEHKVTIIANHDGRIGVRDNRDLAVEHVVASLAEVSPPATVDVDVVSRTGSALDITVVASSQAQATQSAETLVADVVQARSAASKERFTAVIETNTNTLSRLESDIETLNHEINATSEEDVDELSRLMTERQSLESAQDTLVKQRISALASLDASVDPLAVVLSVANGKVAPNPMRTGSVAGAAVAVLALLFLVHRSSNETRNSAE